VAIPSAIEVSGDVVAAATTLAGLVLVFLGATVSSFESYDPIQRGPTLRTRYKRRAWFTFVGFVLSLLASVSALLGKWLGLECAAIAGLALFIVALVWVLFNALFFVREIK
jgi:hypothetical protein